MIRLHIVYLFIRQLCACSKYIQVVQFRDLSLCNSSCANLPSRQWNRLETLHRIRSGMRMGFNMPKYPGNISKLAKAEDLPRRLHAREYIERLNRNLPCRVGCLILFRCEEKTKR